MNRFLVPWNIYGDGVKTLEFHKSKALRDISPFFKSAFDNRDWWLGKPDYGPRQKLNGDIISYYFTMEDFFEAFLRRYNPIELADFFSRTFNQRYLTIRSFN